VPLQAKASRSEAKTTEPAPTSQRWASSLPQWASSLPQVFDTPIAATASEAVHVLDGLLYHQSEVATSRHHTDGGGDGGFK
jgi:hypothetical protein